MINKIDFAAKNLTSNAGLFLLLGNAKTNDIFEVIDTDLVFDMRSMQSNESTNKPIHLSTLSQTLPSTAYIILQRRPDGRKDSKIFHLNLPFSCYNLIISLFQGVP
jgi:hypothetical protein